MQVYTVSAESANDMPVAKIDGERSTCNGGFCLNWGIICCLMNEFNFDENDEESVWITHKGAKENYMSQRTVSG